LGRSEYRPLGSSHVLPEEAEQVILNDPVDVGMEIVEGEATSARQFKAAFFSW
jgi:hypothetical protein